MLEVQNLSMRFGGKDRIERGKQQRAWRRNRRGLHRGLDGDPGSQPASAGGQALTR